MTDQLDPQEEQALRERLTSSVPEAPHSANRASRAATLGRTRQRRAVVAAGLAPLAVTVAVLVPMSLSDVGSDSPAADSGTTTSVVPTDPGDTPDSCSSEADLSQASSARLPFPDKPATWLRFCPKMALDEADAFRNPDVTLTEDVENLVADWIAPQASLNCSPTGNVYGDAFRLQIGFQDGSVRSLTGNASDCLVARLAEQELAVTGRQVFLQSMTALGQQLSETLPAVAPAGPLECPPQPSIRAQADLTATAPSKSFMCAEVRPTSRFPVTRSFM